MLTRRRTEAEIAIVHAAGPEDVDVAVRAAHKALKDASWKLLPATDRGILMTRLAELLEQNKELLATIDAWDNGSCCEIVTIDFILTLLQAKHTQKLSIPIWQKPLPLFVTMQDGRTRPTDKRSVPIT